MKSEAVSRSFAYPARRRTGAVLCVFILLAAVVTLAGCSSGAQAALPVKTTVNTGMPEASEEGSAAGAATGYLFADSNSRFLAEDELANLTDWELYLARNEIYARLGRGFKNSDLAEYFGAQPWSVQAYTPEEFDAADETTMLNPYELANSKLIRSVEERRGSGYLDGRLSGPPDGSTGTVNFGASASGTASSGLEDPAEIIKKLDGYWQAGRQHDSISMLDNGTFKTYTLDGQFLGEGVTLVPEAFIRCENGLNNSDPRAFNGGPGWFICYEPGNTSQKGLYLSDSSDYSSLVPIYIDGSGYSGGDTIGRVSAPDWA